MSLNDDVLIDRLNRFTPIGWFSQLGSGLTAGATWGKCPDCDEECVWMNGKPTAMHRGLTEEQREEMDCDESDC